MFKIRATTLLAKQDSAEGTEVETFSQLFSDKSPIYHVEVPQGFSAMSGKPDSCSGF